MRIIATFLTKRYPLEHGYEKEELAPLKKLIQEIVDKLKAHFEAELLGAVDAEE